MFFKGFKVAVLVALGQGLAVCASEPRRGEPRRLLTPEYMALKMALAEKATENEASDTEETPIQNPTFLGDWLQREFRGKTFRRTGGLREIYPAPTLSAMFQEMEKLLVTSAKPSGYISKAASNLKALRRTAKELYYQKGHRKLSEKRLEPSTCESQVRRLALMIFLMREYESQQSFIPDSRGRQLQAMGRFVSELEENFTSMISNEKSVITQKIEEREGETRMAAYQALAEDLRAASEVFEGTRGGWKYPTAARFVDALDHFHGSVEACESIDDPDFQNKVSQAFSDAILGVVWTPENRREILEAILNMHVPARHHFGESELEERLEMHLDKSGFRKSMLDHLEWKTLPGAERRSSIIFDELKTLPPEALKGLGGVKEQIERLRQRLENGESIRILEQLPLDK